MLRTHDDEALLETGGDWTAFDSTRRVPGAPVVRTTPAQGGIPWQPSAYRASHASSPVAGGASLLLVAGLISAFLWLNVSPPAPVRHDLVTIELRATPPPPPHRAPAPKQQQQASVPRPSQPQIVTPPPAVAIPAPSPVAIVRQPDPAPVVTAAPVAPVIAAPPTPPPAIASAGDLSSTMISATPPKYPLEARRAHEEGTVVLKLVLSTEGQVSDIAVARSSGSDRLDQAALSAVRKWRWRPMLRSGQAVMVQGNVTIPFVLQR